LESTEQIPRVALLASFAKYAMGKRNADARRIARLEIWRNCLQTAPLSMWLPRRGSKNPQFDTSTLSAGIKG